MNGREAGGVRSAGFVAVLGIILLLVIAIVAMVQGGGGSGGGTSASASSASASTVVATFSGGGSGIETGTTEPFTVSGGKQTVTLATPQHGDYASLQVYIEDEAGFSKGELMFPFAASGDTRWMDLPAGTYVATWQSGDCTWEMTITE